MSLAGKKIALFVAKYFEDLEFWYPKIRMQEEGAGIVVIGPEAETYTGKYGIPAKADEAIIDVDPDDFDALIIPGGYSPDHMRRSPKMVEFVKIMHQQKKVIATICHGGWMLASAGILEGKKATSFYAIKDDMVNAGAKWLDEEVVVDVNLITSRSPADLPAFCKAIIKAVK
ncbi:DJ-1/PfpI/YhbO family deglycase/protease [candidate division KSB1 bacterium]|nr:DJ-1/PfpI/YhbO family deglycase/protease [candidate division KSB1 bacterium]